MSKTNKGYTLIEAVITLGLWLVLSIGIFFVWQHAALSAASMLESQNAFENARITMDVLKMNINMSRCIEISKNSNANLSIIALNQRDPHGIWEPYNFRLNSNQLQIGQPGRGWNEISSNISTITIRYMGDRLRIEVITTCDEPQILEGSVCTRYKCLSINGWRRNQQICPQDRH